jgi:putative DNA primase/helicase
MATLDQVLEQMRAAGLPALPAGHPLYDGKIHRFGPGKKAWYVLREIRLDRGGKDVLAGSFGVWFGDDNNAVPVSIDWSGISQEERSALERKQAEVQRAAEEEKRRQAEMAANRAREEWKVAVDTVEHAYLARKRVGGECTRVNERGELLVPVRKYSRTGGMLAGLQKIAADGEKRFTSHMDMIGGACVLGVIDDGTPLIAVVEGYATGETVRMATDFTIPVAVAYNAGNLLAVAQQLRADFPSAHILFLADDDMRLVSRLREAIEKHFDALWLPQVDGVDHEVIAVNGDIVQVRATWRRDATGTEWIEADARAGRRMLPLRKFENAGLSRARAAAHAVGNASVAWPAFADRQDDKWSDYNDLYLAESLDVMRDQVQAAISRALVDDGAPAVGTDIPAHFDDAPLPDALDSPAPLGSDVEPVMRGALTLEWALAHCALVQGTTDVWDSLHKLRMKRAGFQETVGKDVARAWTEHAERRSISPRQMPRTIRGVAVDEGAAGADNIVMMLERYTLLYGTKTVWDAEKRTVIAYDAMSLARGSDLATRWLEHPMRREVDLDKLVFDPAQQADLETHINMFGGLPLSPRKDDEKAGLAVQLLYSLCSGEGDTEAIVRWVLCWLAYPLQHPGAKMQTALLFFGEKQGTGKSLFFEGIVKPIYGEYGVTGGQHQLDAQYTAWRSQKLFVLFEEILSRQDKYSHFGLVKHMITGRDQMVTQKFKDDRAEANHMNGVLLSNEFQAVPIEPDDRRFLVNEASTPLDEALRLAIKREIDAGTALSAAFYAFLLEYPLGDFDPHTKPLMTPSKERMISFGRPDWEAFYLTWKAGELAAPFCSCLSSDLYTVYARYCNKYGFRQMTITKFAELIAQRIKKDRQWVALGAAPTKKLLTVFHVPWTDEKEPEPTLSKQCERFQNLAEIKG